MFGMSNWKTLFGILFPVLISDVIWRWDAESACSHPLRLWLLGLYVSMIVLRGFTVISDAFKSLSAARTTIIVQVGFLLPYKIALTILGLVWQNGNMKEWSYQCNLPIGMDWLMCFWLGVSICFDCHFAFSTYTGLKIYQTRVLFNEVAASTTDMLNHPTLVNIMLRIQEQSAGSTGLTESEMSKVEKLTIDDIMSQNEIFKKRQKLCAICTETFVKSQVIFKLPVCEHLYHENCIKQWLVAKPQCPLCRANVRTNLTSNSLVLSE